MRKLIRRHLPHPAKLNEHKIFALLGRHLLHPRLWHLNRHSAAGGIAIGVFCSLIPGPMQMLGAAILCVYLRVNLPLALVGTWISNPLTIAPMYLVAFYIGRFVTGSESQFLAPPPLDLNQLSATLAAWWQWTLSLGYPLLIGLPLLALLLSAISYFCVKWGWELHLRCVFGQRRALSASKPQNTEPNNKSLCK
jgi:uncharacterized protein